MIKTIIAALLAIFLTLCIGGAVADNAEENSWIINYIEQQISTPQRQIHFQGVHGALSAKASIDRITISDQAGLWLEINQAQIDWQRSALLQGYLVINKLSAQKVRLLRQPQKSQEHADYGFSLSDLPVNIDIGQVSFADIEFAKPAFGTQARLMLEGSAKFIGHDLASHLNIVRLDAPGRLELEASYSTLNKKLSLKLDAFESADGIIANLLQIEGRPKLELKLEGGGTTDDMELNLRTKAGDKQVLGGSLKIHPANDAKGKHIQLDLNGPVRMIMPPIYQPLFDDHSALWLDADIRPDHSIIVHEAKIEGSILSLDAYGSLLPDGFLRRAFILARLKPSRAHEPIKLPFNDGHMTASEALLRLDYGAENSEAWQGELNIQDFKTSRQAAPFSAHIALHGIAQRLEQPETRYVTLEADGLLQHDAIKIKLNASAQLRGHTPILVKNLSLTTRNSVIQTSGTIANHKFTGYSHFNISDLRSLAAFFGRTASGMLNIAGKSYIDFSRLSPAHLQASQEVSGCMAKISAGFIPTLLRPLFGPGTAINGMLLYQNRGIGFKDFSAHSSLFDLEAAGMLNRNEADMSAQLTLKNLHAINERLGGSAAIKISAQGKNSILSLGAQIMPQNLYINGQVIEEAQARAMVIIAGANRLVPRYHLFGTLQGRQGGKVFSGKIDYDDHKQGAAGLQHLDLNLLQPFVSYKLPHMQISASAKLAGQRVNFVLDSETPSIPLHANGSYNLRYKQLDSQIIGQVNLNLFNHFFTNQGFNLDGQLMLNAHILGDSQHLNAIGSLAVTEGNFYDVKHNVHLQHINISGQLQGNRLTIERAYAHAMEGGEVQLGGAIEYRNPLALSANLQANLLHVHYSKGGFFSTTMSGRLYLSGDLLTHPHISGDVLLEQSELLIARNLSAKQPLRVRHIAPTRCVLRTLGRANLLRRRSVKAKRQFAADLDINISAPQKLFIRGMGLNVEMGGAINLRSHGPIMHPIGSFKMIRGEINLLGQRLNLNSGTAILNGNLQPLLNFAASTNVDKIAINVSLTGSSNDMKIVLTSTPDLPQDEILAHLLFRHNLKQLSPLQLTQIISTLAQFSGENSVDILGNIRQASGLADLDINSDENGDIGLSAGRYITKNTYVNITATQTGKTKATLNWDFNEHIKTKAQLSSDNNNSAGIFFEKDY